MEKQRVVQPKLELLERKQQDGRSMAEAVQNAQQNHSLVKKLKRKLFSEKDDVPKQEEDPGREDVFPQKGGRLDWAANLLGE